MLQKIQETAQWIKAHTQLAPETAIVLGTGLGRLAAEIEVVDAFPYSEIPNFPVSTVEGHSGRLLFGRLGGKEVMALEGRFHYYEGYTMKEVTFPVRVMHELGIKTLFVSNAAGGMNPDFEIGDLMLITDLGVEGKIVEVSHEEVQRAANAVQPLMADIFREMIHRM